MRSVKEGSVLTHLVRCGAAKVRMDVGVRGQVAASVSAGQGIASAVSTSVLECPTQCGRRRIGAGHARGLADTLPVVGAAAAFTVACGASVTSETRTRHST